MWINRIMATWMEGCQLLQDYWQYYWQALAQQNQPMAVEVGHSCFEAWTSFEMVKAFEDSAQRKVVGHCKVSHHLEGSLMAWNLVGSHHKYCSFVIQLLKHLKPLHKVDFPPAGRQQHTPVKPMHWACHYFTCKWHNPFTNFTASVQWKIKT